MTAKSDHKRLVQQVCHPERSEGSHGQILRYAQNDICHVVRFSRNGVVYLTFLAVFLLSLVFAACTAAPFTQRRQVMLVSETQEIALGIELYREILRQSILNHDVTVNRIVRRVGERIAQVANKPNYFCGFVVIDEPYMVNAWALPGGQVGIY